MSSKESANENVNTFVIKFFGDRMDRLNGPGSKVFFNLILKIGGFSLLFIDDFGLPIRLVLIFIRVLIVHPTLCFVVLTKFLLGRKSIKVGSFTRREFFPLDRN